MLDQHADQGPGLAAVVGPIRDFEEQIGFAPLQLRSLSLEAAGPAVRFILRGDAAVATAAGAAFGAEPPREPCRAAGK